MVCRWQVGARDVCPFKADSYGVCNYELDGMQGQCCTRGDVAVGSAM